MSKQSKKEEPSDLEKRISDAFKLFDHTNSDAVDVREIGTIIRSLGCCPTEAELQEILVQVEDQEMSGSVKLNRFLPVMAEILQENRLQGAEPEVLLAAFRALDSSGSGKLDPEKLRNLLMTEGEPFSAEEMDDMLAAAVDSESGLIPYEDFIPKLMGAPIKSSVANLTELSASPLGLEGWKQHELLEGCNHTSESELTLLSSLPSPVGSHLTLLSWQHLT